MTFRAGSSRIFYVSKNCLTWKKKYLQSLFTFCTYWITRLGYIIFLLMKRQLNMYGISYWKIWITCLCIGIYYSDFLFSLLSSLLIVFCGINHSETSLYLSNFKLLISFLNCQVCFPFRTFSEKKGILILNSEVLRYCFSGIQAILSVDSSDECYLDRKLHVCACFLLP